MLPGTCCQPAESLLSFLVQDIPDSAAPAGLTPCSLLPCWLQELPDSGMLWAEAITMAPRPQRKSKSADALKRVTDSPLVVAAVAQLFVADRF